MRQEHQLKGASTQAEGEHPRQLHGRRDFNRAPNPAKIVDWVIGERSPLLGGRVAEGARGGSSMVQRDHARAWTLARSAVVIAVAAALALPAAIATAAQPPGVGKPPAGTSMGSAAALENPLCNRDAGNDGFGRLRFVEEDGTRAPSASRSGTARTTAARRHRELRTRRSKSPCSCPMINGSRPSSRGHSFL